MFGIRSKPSLLKPSRVLVECEGELVVLEINGTRMKMSYENAITLSQWLRVRGKEAKRFSGDMSRHWHGIAVLNGAPEK
jgi:hypothetical protein